MCSAGNVTKSQQHRTLTNLQSTLGEYEVQLRDMEKRTVMVSLISDVFDMIIIQCDFSCQIFFQFQFLFPFQLNH